MKNKTVCGYTVSPEIAEAVISVAKVVAQKTADAIEKYPSMNMVASVIDESLANELCGEIKRILIKELFGSRPEALESQVRLYKRASLCPVCGGDSGNPNQLHPPGPVDCVCGGQGTAQAAYYTLAADYATVSFQLKKIRESESSPRVDSLEKTC